MLVTNSIIFRELKWMRSEAKKRRTDFHRDKDVLGERLEGTCMDTTTTKNYNSTNRPTFLQNKIKNLMQFKLP